MRPVEVEEVATAVEAAMAAEAVAAARASAANTTEENMVEVEVVRIF